MGTHIDESIRKKIEDHARKELYAETNNGRNWMPTRKELQILTRIEAAEFGYQLAQEELNKAFREGVEQGYRQATSKEPYNEPTQDELWEGLEDTCTDANCNLIIEEAKKRYRITRITS